MVVLGRLLASLCFVFAASAATAAERLTLAEISAYLNGISTLKSEFTQINDDGSISTGTLYIRRPGRMRFEYNPPEQALVIAAASAVVIIDKKSNQPPETYPLRRTPLSLILDQSIDLTRANMVKDARFDGTTTTVTARDPERQETGFIELVFTDNPTELRQWTIYDSNGSQTTVILGAFESGLDLPETLFDPGRELNRRSDR